MASALDEPQRRCLVTRTSRPKAALVRFVVGPDGRVWPDVAGRLPGRGMWLSADRDVINRAATRNLFARAARAPVRVDPGLADEVELLLVKRALDDLGLARRAGMVVTGYEKVRGRLRSGAVAALVAAADGAPGGRRKLRQLAPDLPCIAAFTRDELGAALGLENVVHAAVAPGSLARRLLCDAGRLAGFRPGALETGRLREAAPGDGETPITTGTQ